MFKLTFFICCLFVVLFVTGCKIEYCNGCSPTYDEESFTPPSSFQRSQICPDIVFFAIRFCNCISAIFLPLHYNFSSQLTANLSFFNIKLDWVYYRSQNTQSLLCIPVHSDISTNRRQRYMSKTCFAKIFKLNLSRVLLSVLTI